MDNRSPQVLLVAILFATLTWIMVGLRCYVRGRMLHNFGLDDWLMLATQLLFTAYIINQLGGVAFGTGRHKWDLTKEANETALHFWFFCELFYILSCSLLKIAIGVFLMRVAVKKIHILIIKILIVGTAIFGTAYFFLALFQCSPISAWYTKGPSSDSCIDPKIITGATYCASVINSCADWTFGILPIFIVWDLEMARRQKILVATILAFAAIGSTATIVRIPSISGLERTRDFLWDTTDIAIWSTVEVGIGISAGCAATLRPLMHAIFKSDAWRSHIPVLSNGRGNRSNRSGGALTPSIKLTNLSSNLSRSRSRSEGFKSPLPFRKLDRSDAFRPDKVGNTTIVTTTTPPNRSRKDTASSEELCLDGDSSSSSIVYGIAKTEDVVVTWETRELREIDEIAIDLEKNLPSLPSGSQPGSISDHNTRLSDRSTPSERPSGDIQRLPPAQKRSFELSRLRF